MSLRFQVASSDQATFDPIHLLRLLDLDDRVDEAHGAVQGRARARLGDTAERDFARRPLHQSLGVGERVEATIVREGIRRVGLLRGVIGYAIGDAAARVWPGLALRHVEPAAPTV